MANVYNVYMDDSGTAPSQRIAIASALVIPASCAQRLQAEWANFAEEYGIGAKGFHASECVHRNPKSHFARWDDEKVRAAMANIREMIKVHSVAAFSFAVKKIDFDELVPPQLKQFQGEQHYTWAIRHVLNLLRRWVEMTAQDARMEYFFDWQEGTAKKEIEKLMKQEEELRPGFYAGHFSFQRRREVPALQCVDMLAWCCFAQARRFYEDTPLNPVALESYLDFRDYQNRRWMTAATVTRPNLEKNLRRHFVLS